MRRLLPLITLLLAFAAACGEEGGAGVQGSEEPRRFVADLDPLNRSDAGGTVRMTLQGNKLTFDLDAVGLEPEIHAQQIRGFLDGERGADGDLEAERDLEAEGDPEAAGNAEASCPEREDDEDGDGFVGLGEGKRTYGERLLKLDPYPTANRSRKLSWDLTIPVDPGELGPLESRVYLLLGRSANVDGKRGAEYVPSMPVACGRIEPLGGMATEGAQG